MTMLRTLDTLIARADVAALADPGFVPSWLRRGQRWADGDDRPAAYLQGYKDFSPYTDSTCPYEAGTQEAVSWQRGYDAHGEAYASEN